MVVRGFERGLTMRTRTLNRPTVNPLLFVAALALAGCWTAPIARVQPKGEPRLIQGGVAVESVKGPAIVQSVDSAARTLVVMNPGDFAKSTYKAGSNVTNFDQIKAGDKVQATLAQELTIYVLKNGQVPDPGRAPKTIKGDAKVLMVDPSYRLLTLQFPNGRNQTFKVGLDVKLLQMEAGDDVVIRTIEAVALELKAP